MNTIFIASTLFLAMLTSQSFATDTTNTDYENFDEEAIGLGIGSMVGGILGGPAGLMAGALAGALVGDSVGNDKEVLLLSSELKQSNTTINTLQESNEEQTQALADAQATVEKLLTQNQELELNALEFAVQFRTNSSDIEKHYKDQLEKIAEILLQTPDSEIDIAGFADRMGDEIYNMELSGQRAAAVKEFLAQQGVDRKRITSHAYGETKPIKPSESLENNFFDRRVAIRFHPIEVEDQSQLSVAAN